MESVVYVYSKHPLASKAIIRAVSLSLAPNWTAKVLSIAQRLSGLDVGTVLVLDTCCMDDWPRTAVQWSRCGGRTIIIVLPDSVEYKERLNNLYFGASGVVTWSEEFESDMGKALNAVTEGRFWINRDVLDEHVRRTVFSLRGSQSPEKQLTAREQQIAHFMKQRFSNKRIADMLEISERTVKFHVSNILRKSGAGSRREFR